MTLATRGLTGAAPDALRPARAGLPGARTPMVS